LLSVTHVSGMDPVGNGRGDWIRTSDISLPKRALYQAEPRPDLNR
jgi:hypothetical protein